MRTGTLRSLCSLSLGLSMSLNAAASAPGSDTSPPLDEPSSKVSIVGLWLGDMEHNGQTSSMLLELAEGEGGALVAKLSFPDLHAWDVVAIPAQLDESRLTIGSWTLERRSDGTIAGHLPSTFVPVHQIPVVFRRVASVKRDVAPAIVAPRAEPVWTRDLGAAVWADLGTGAELGLLYVGDDSGTLHALDATSGSTRWSYATGGAIRARPTSTGGTLYVHSDDGHLYALDPASGDERWRASVGEVTRVPLGAEGFRYDHYSSGVAVAGGLLYVGTFDGRVLALDAASGNERWSFAAGDTVAGTPAVDGGRVFFGSFDGNVYSVDAATGTELWRYDTGEAVVSSPAIHAGLVVIGSRSYDLFALAADSGEPVWKYYYWFSWVESSVSVRDGIGYVGSSDGQILVAIDLPDGEPRWTFDTGGCPWAQPAVTDDAVFIGSVGVAGYWVAHEAAFFAVDRSTGEALWQYPLAAPEGAAMWGFAASPAVGADFAYAADTSGTVYAFRRR